jgi:hypothetical protein
VPRRKAQTTLVEDGSRQAPRSEVVSEVAALLQLDRVTLKEWWHGTDEHWLQRWRRPSLVTMSGRPSLVTMSTSEDV